jgi:hypothetical protein
MEIIDFMVAQKWVKIPKNIKRILRNNTFCSKCGITTIVQYTFNDDEFGVLLIGKCKKCGNDVRKLVGDEQK